MKNIFVSSTFRDMQAERDMIQEEVLPQMRSKAKEYGENINMIDLRWGVDTSELESEEGSMKVMSVCLDEVERSRPHMLIFLGDRYGSIIDPAITEKVIARKDSEFALEDYAISITAMEVEFGALSQQFDSLENCVVCMRRFNPAVIGEESERTIYSAENEELAEKQRAFKQKVWDKVQGRVIEYTGDWDESKKQLVNFRTMEGEALSKKLVGIYETMFQKEWDNYSKLSWEEKEQLAVDALVESKLRTFNGREKLLDRYYKMATTETGTLILQGEVGSGKTSIMCKLIERLEQNGERVFRFIAGNSSMSENAMQLVKQMVYYLETILDEVHYEKRADVSLKKYLVDGAEGKYSDWLERLAELAAQLDEGQKIYFVIDALDQMYQDESVKGLDFVLNNPKLRYILSCTFEYKIPEIKNGYKLEVEEVPLLSVEDAKEVIEGILTASSRNVYKDMQEAVLSKKSANNPLYISMLIQRLNMMGFDELHGAWTEKDIIHHGTEVIQKIPDGAQRAAVYMFDEAIKRLDAKAHGLMDVIHLIGISRSGLRENDILAISAELGNQVSQLELSRLIHYLDTFFVIHQDGQIDFTHKVIRNGVRTNAKDEMYLKAIATRVDAMDEEDTFWKHEGMYYARMTRNAYFARSILDYAAKCKDKIVLGAIKAETLADKGEFLCKQMRVIGDSMSFFCGVWMELFDLKREELAVWEKVSIAFMESLEQKSESEKTDEVCRCLSTSYRNVGKILREQGKVAEALLYYSKARDTADVLYAEEKTIQNARGCAESYECVGLAFVALGNAAEAQEYFQKALTMREAIYKEEPTPNSFRALGDCYSYMGQALLSLEKAQDALSYFEKELEISEKIYKDDLSIENKKEYAIGRKNRSDALYELERLDDALVETAAFIQIMEEVHKEQKGIDNLQLLYFGYADKGDILMHRQRVSDALIEYHKALKVAEDVHNACQNITSLKRMARLTICIAQANQKQENQEEALVFYQKALNYEEEIYKANPTLSRLEWIVEIADDIETILLARNKEEEQQSAYARVMRLAKYLGEPEVTLDNLECIKGIIETLDSTSMRRLPGFQSFYEKMLENAIAINDVYHNATSLDVLQLCYVVAAIGAMDRREMNAARTYYKEANKVAKEVYKLNPSLQNYFVNKLQQAAFGLVAFGLKRQDKSVEKAHNVETDKRSLHQKNLMAVDYYSKGRSLHNQGELEQAISFLEKAIALSEEVNRNSSRVLYKNNLAATYKELAHVLKSCQSFKDAITYYKKSLELMEVIQKEKPNVENLMEIVVLANNIAELVAIRGSKETVYEYRKKELDANEAVYKAEKTVENLQHLSVSVYNMASALRKMGKQEECVVYFRRCLALQEEIYEKTQSPNSLKQLSASYSNVSVALLDIGEVDEGLMYCRKALEVEERIYLSSLSLESLEQLATGYKRMVDTLKSLKRIDESLEYYKKYIETIEEIYKLYPTDKNENILLDTYRNLGMTFSGYGKVDEAMEGYKKYAEVSEAIYQKNPDWGKRRNFIESLGKAGQLLLALGQNEEAYEYQKRALLEAQEFYEEKPSDILKSFLVTNKYRLAYILQMSDRTDKAIAFYESALELAKELITEKPSYSNYESAAKIEIEMSKIYLSLSSGLNAKRYAQEAYNYLKEAFREEVSEVTAVSLVDTMIRAIAAYVKGCIALGMYRTCPGYLEEAEAYLKQLDKPAQRLKRMRLKMIFLDAQGEYYHAAGEEILAKNAYREALRLADEVRDIWDNEETRSLKKLLEQKLK